MKGRALLVNSSTIGTLVERMEKGVEEDMGSSEAVDDERGMNTVVVVGKAVVEWAVSIISFIHSFQSSYFTSNDCYRTHYVQKSSKIVCKIRNVK